MKYIRTKDGIFDETEHRHTIKNGKVSIMGIFYELKQADTIEELCDGFVITSKQGHIYDTYGIYSYELKEVLPQAKTEEPDEDWDLYGVILIDGIIKQVAVANDKGELELL